MIRITAHPWLRLAVTTGVALAVWGLAAAHGYGWSTIWLPAVVAGAAWPPIVVWRRNRTRLGAMRVRSTTRFVLAVVVLKCRAGVVPVWSERL